MFCRKACIVTSERAGTVAERQLARLRKLDRSDQLSKKGVEFQVVGLFKAVRPILGSQ